MDLLERVEALRIPPQPESAAADWKDWYHFVLLHPASGWRAIVNVNLAGGGESAQVQTTLVVHPPGGAAALAGASRAVPWRTGDVRARPLAIRTEETELEFANGVFALRVQPAGLDLGLALEVRPDATPMLVTEGSPFGSGFIGWGLVPRCRVHGELWACGRQAAVDAQWFCYQDHNFGRFRWGEDFGWEWMVAHARVPDGPELTVVVDLRTDRTHSGRGLPYLFIVVGGHLRKVFLGPAMALRWNWAARPERPPRLPGAMATLLGDHSARPPQCVHLHAADEQDRVTLTLPVDSYLEIVAADHRSPAFTRIGEASGPVRLALTLDGQTYEADGLAYAEYTR